MNSGSIDEDDVLPAQLVMRDAAVGGSQVLKEQDGIGWLEKAAAEIEEEIQREARRIAKATALDHGPLLSADCSPVGGDVPAVAMCIRMRGAAQARSHYR